MKLNHDRLHKDILIKLRRVKMSQREFNIKRGIARSTLYRISIKKPITLETFFNLVQWLDEDINRYVIK